MLKIIQNIRHFFGFETTSLKFQSIRSAVWSVFGRGAGLFIRVAGNLILTRILFPEAFGLMATANVIIMIVQLFSDTGVQTAIIQNPRGDQPEFLGTVMVIKIFRGVLLSIFIAVCAWPAAIVYKENALKPILLIMCISPAILAFNNPAIPILVKKFKLSRQVVMELTYQIAGLLLTIVLALWQRSVFALAIGYSLTSLCRVAVSYMVFPYRPIFRWNKQSGRELFHFGKYVFLNTLITAAVFHLDVLLIGKLLNMEMLSFYNIGKNLGTVVTMFAASVVSQSYMPAVSHVQDDLERVKRIYQRTVSFFLAVLLPASIVLALFAHDIIRFMYDPRYELSYISLFWFGLAGIFRVIGGISASTFIAIGKPVFETLSMMMGFVLVAVLIFIGGHYFELSGVSCAMAFATSLVPVIECIFLVKGIGFSKSVVFRSWGQALFVTGICTGIFLLLRPWLSTNRFYNFPFMIIMGLISLSVSFGVHRYLEGTNPFRDYSEAPSSREQVPRSISSDAG